MLRAAFCSKLQHVTNTPDSRSSERSYVVIQSTCLSKLVEQECHKEGEVYASNGVMSDMFFVD